MFIYPFYNWVVSSLGLLWIMFYECFFCIFFSSHMSTFLLGIYLGEKLLCFYVYIVLVDAAKQFSKWSCQFMFPPTIHEHFSCLYKIPRSILLTLIIATSGEWDEGRMEGCIVYTLKYLFLKWFYNTFYNTFFFLYSIDFLNLVQIYHPLIL